MIILLLLNVGRVAGPSSIPPLHCLVRWCFISHDASGQRFDKRITLKSLDLINCHLTYSASQRVSIDMPYTLLDALVYTDSSMSKVYIQMGS